MARQSCKGNALARELIHQEAKISEMDVDDEHLSQVVKNCLGLFMANLTENPVETTLRMRALQTLSEGVSTDVVQLIAKAVERARGADVLDDNLRAYLGITQR